MSWKDKAIELCKRYGAPAKFAAKMILGSVLPGSPVVVELVSEILDCVHETAKDQLTFEDRPLAATAEDLRRVEDMLAVLANDLAPLMAQVAAFEDMPDRAAKLLDVAMATDERCQTAVRRLDQLARRFDRLEKQNDDILKGQGYASAMLAEMLPLMRHMSGVADFVADLHAANLRIDEFRTCLHEFQEAARAFSAGRIAEAGTQFSKVAQAQPLSSAGAVALAAAKAAGQDFQAAEQSIARAARLRPEDKELAELHQRVTVASRGPTPRERDASGSASRQPKVGDTLDGWRLDLLLGHGGWGRVFKASRGDEIRALKVMHPELSRDPLFVERFKKEILTLASLRGHKHLIAIESFGYAADAACWYFVMELIVGTSLERYLQRRGALTLPQARPVFLELAEGLAAA